MNQIYQNQLEASNKKITKNKIEVRMNLKTKMK